MSELLTANAATRRVWKNKEFAAFARKQNIADAALCKAVEDVRRGLIDADLGGGVLKQRLARPGQGKSGGYRTIILFQIERHTFFVYGFAKNERDNIRHDELTELRELAKRLLFLTEGQLQIALAAGQLFEVNCDA